MGQPPSAVARARTGHEYLTRTGHQEGLHGGQSRRLTSFAPLADDFSRRPRKVANRAAASEGFGGAFLPQGMAPSTKRHRDERSDVADDDSAVDSESPAERPVPPFAACLRAAAVSAQRARFSATPVRRHAPPRSQPRRRPAG